MLIRFVKLFLFIAIASTLGVSQVYTTKNEALALYLGEKNERHTIFLTDGQVKTIQQKAKAKVESKIVTYYSSQKGYAFFESRTVRTMPATFIVVVNAAGNIRAVEMLAFYEPEDYLPPKKWMGTFEHKTIDDDLWLKRGVYNISGATLSAQAITESVRKILATYQIAIAKEQQ